MLRDASLIPLSHQHHNGLALCVLTERSLREDPSPANVEKLARKTIDRYELERTNSQSHATSSRKAATILRHLCGKSVSAIPDSMAGTAEYSKR